MKPPQSDEVAAAKADIPGLAPFYLTLAMVVMANTILATALPAVTAELSGAQDYAAVVTAYLLPKALATPLGGRLVDAFNPKRVVYGFFFLYLVTSIGCGMVRSMPELLIWRVFQGLGGGGLMASIYTTIDLMVPPRSQGKVQASIATVLGAGAAAAPLIGGLVTEYLGWRWCFFLNVPVLLYCLAAIRKMPSMTARGRAGIDWKGTLALALFSCPLMLAFTWGGTSYDWRSPEIIGLFVVSLLAGPLFWWLEKLPEEPLFDPALAGDPILRWSFLAGFALGGAFLGSMLYLPLFVTVVKGATASQAGAALLPFILGSIVGAVFGGYRVETTQRYQRTAVLGSAGAGLVALLLFFQLQGPFNDVVFYILQFLLAFAFGSSQDMYSIAVQNSTPVHRQGMTGSSLEFVRQLGSALGLALVGSIFLISLNKVMPGQLQRWLGPLQLHVSVEQLEDPDQLTAIHKEIFSAIVARAKRAVGGDAQSYEELERSPIMTAQLKKLLAPSAHHALAGKDVDELKAAAEETDQALISALAGSVQEAQRRVYLLTALLCLVALFASWRLPDRELLEALREREEEEASLD